MPKSSAFESNPIFSIEERDNPAFSAADSNPASSALESRRSSSTLHRQEWSVPARKTRTVEKKHGHVPCEELRSILRADGLGTEFFVFVPNGLGGRTICFRQHRSLCHVGTDCECVCFAWHPRFLRTCYVPIVLLWIWQILSASFAPIFLTLVPAARTCTFVFLSILFVVGRLVRSNAPSIVVHLVACVSSGFLSSSIAPSPWMSPPRRGAAGSSRWRGRDRDSHHRDLEGKVSMGGVGIRMGSTSIRSIHRVVEKDPNPSIYLLPSGFHIEGEVRKGQHQPLGEPGKEDMCEDPLPIQHKVQRGMNAMKKRTRERNTCTAAVWENPQLFQWDTIVSRNNGAAVDPLRNVTGFHLPTAHNACIE